MNPQNMSIVKEMVDAVNEERKETALSKAGAEDVVARLNGFYKNSKFVVVETPEPKKKESGK